MIKKEEKLDKESIGGTPSSGAPTDIHNYSGWASGGHSETMDDDPLDFDADE